MRAMLIVCPPRFASRTRLRWVCISARSLSPLLSLPCLRAFCAGICAERALPFVGALGNWERPLAMFRNDDVVVVVVERIWSVWLPAARPEQNGEAKRKHGGERRKEQEEKKKKKEKKKRKGQNKTASTLLHTYILYAAAARLLLRTTPAVAARPINHLADEFFFVRSGSLTPPNAASGGRFRPGGGGGECVLPPLGRMAPAAGSYCKVPQNEHTRLTD